MAEQAIGLKYTHRGVWVLGTASHGLNLPGYYFKRSFLGDREGQKESARFEAENISYNYLLKGALLKAIVKLSFRRERKVK